MSSHIIDTGGFDSGQHNIIPYNTFLKKDKYVMTKSTMVSCKSKMSGFTQ